MVNDSPWTCHQVDPPSWLFRRWPLLEWSSTSPKPHSYPPSILTATHWMFINDHKKSYCWTHCSSRFFSYPHRCYFCLSSKTFNELSSVSSSYSDNSQGPPHELPHKSTASSFHWETPYSPASLLTVYNQICLLLYLPLMGFFKHVLLCWLLQKKHAGLRDIK